MMGDLSWNKVLGLLGLEQEEEPKFALIRSGVNSDREVRRSRKERKRNRSRRVRREGGKTNFPKSPILLLLSPLPLSLF